MSPLDEELLAEAREAQAHALAQAELARVRFAGAVRRLHGGGASMREIARAFKVSHQRVHQLVTGEDKHSSPVRCSFCGTGQKETKKLIAGPGVYICDRCIELGTKVVRSDARARRRWAAIERPDIGRSRKHRSPSDCSFCGKAPSQVAGMADSGAVRICSECLDLCNEIMAEELGKC